MSRRNDPTERQWQELCDEGIAEFERLRRDGPEVFRRARLSARSDGYPTSTRVGEGAAASVVDDELVPMPPVPDRVGELAVAEERRDPLRESAEAMNDHVLAAIRLLRAADGARARAFPPAPADVDDDEGCVVHARYRIWAPVRARGRCRFCNDYARDHDFADPSEEVIRALEDRRIRAQQRRPA